MRNFLICLFSLIFFSVTSCKKPCTFDDLPEDFEARKTNHEKVTRILKNLDKKSKDELKTLARHKDHRIRRAVVQKIALYAQKDPQISDLLYNLAQTDQVPRVRSSSMRAIGISKNEGASGALILGLCDADPEVAVYAWKSIIKLESKAYNALLETLAPDFENGSKSCVKSPHHPKITVSQEVRNRLIKMDSKAIPILRAGLKHKNRSIVNASLEMLGRLGENAAPALEDIIEMLSESDEKTKNLALSAITKIGDQHPKVMPALFAAKADKSTAFAQAATQSIDLITASAQRALAQAQKEAQKKSGKPAKK
jgi:HEAT repeat protein